MAVITISRGSFSGGLMLAEFLSEELGFRIVDRDVIVERATAGCGISQQELRNALEKPPTFLERLKHKRYLYLAVTQAALAEEVRDGKVIYHGNAGHLLLKGGGPVFRVRIIAPLEFRIAMAQKRLGLGPREVTEYIQKVDEERRRWTQYLYGVDWTDASLYDTVINLEYIDLENAAHLIAGAIKRQKCFQFDERCRDTMYDLARASRVKCDLALNPLTSGLELEVAAEGGHLHVKGKISTVDQIEEIDRVARQVEGVEKVDLDDLVSAAVA